MFCIFSLERWARKLSTDCENAARGQGSGLSVPPVPGNAVLFYDVSCTAGQISPERVTRWSAFFKYVDSFLDLRIFSLRWEAPRRC